jgi:hypothetical protein
MKNVIPRMNVSGTTIQQSNDKLVTRKPKFRTGMFILRKMRRVANVRIRIQQTFNRNQARYGCNISFDKFSIHETKNKKGLMDEYAVFGSVT